MHRKIFYGLNGVVYPEGKSHPDIKIGAPVVSIDNSPGVNGLKSGETAYLSNPNVMLLDFVCAEYRKWGQFGPYGDVISVTHFTAYSKDFFVINYIGRFEHHKPSLAADLLPFIIDKDGRVFFVGIVRGREPGRGKPAFIGGHQDIDGFRLETAVAALMHEAKDEASFSIVPAMAGADAVDKPYAKAEYVQLGFGGRFFYAMLELVGVYNTGWEEKNKSTGHKRVDQATAYLVRLHIDESLNCNKIASWFKAGDDAKDVVVIRADEEIPDFGISHHMEIYRDAVYNLHDWGVLKLPHEKLIELGRRVNEMIAAEPK